MPRIAKLTAFAIPLLLAACGSSSSSTTSSATSSAATSSSAPAAASGGQVTLSETEFKITPATPAVAGTGTITITMHNTGKITHALAVQTPSGVVKTGDIAPGATATLKVDLAQAGSYAFYCPIDSHRMLGMKGTLVVGGSGAAASGGAAPTTSSSSSASGY